MSTLRPLHESHVPSEYFPRTSDHAVPTVGKPLLRGGNRIIKPARCCGLAEDVIRGSYASPAKLSGHLGILAEKTRDQLCAALYAKLNEDVAKVKFYGLLRHVQ